MATVIGIGCCEFRGEKAVKGGLRISQKCVPHSFSCSSTDVPFIVFNWGVLDGFYAWKFSRDIVMAPENFCFCGTLYFNCEIVVYGRTWLVNTCWQCHKFEILCKHSPYETKTWLVSKNDKIHPPFEEASVAKWIKSWTSMHNYGCSNATKVWKF